jgi:superfamily I DNA/RNA helicase
MNAKSIVTRIFLISEHSAPKILIVSGPGTGKSYLFLERINSWLKNDSDANIFVTSFVRKLVADLQSDIEEDDTLSDKLDNQIIVSTLHKFARSVLERNKGTKAWPYKKHIRIISNPWNRVVWADVLNFYPDLITAGYSLKKFEHQLFNNQFENTDEWKKLKETYFELCKFYNAAGFADLIIRANTALQENPELNTNLYLIIDEYQDFNLAENELLQSLIQVSKGVLLVGDDEQVLYDTLKLGKSTLIRGHYSNTEYVKCMLPYCSRSNYHISKTASYFIQQHRDEETIEKIYLPIKSDDTVKKVQTIACSHPSSAVGYVEKFVSKMKDNIDQRVQELENGDSKEAFLLILTPSSRMNYLGKYKDRLDSIISQYQAKNRLFSDDHYKILSYHSIAIKPKNNFTFRKILFHEGVGEERVHELILSAIQENQDLCDLDCDEITNVLLKCDKINEALKLDGDMDEKVINDIAQEIQISDKSVLVEFFNQYSGEQSDEEQAELEAMEIKQMNAIELMSIVRSKGLSADHVIVMGFDNVNMNYLTKNAFYVALTRARNSLHLVTSLKSGGATDVHPFFHQLPEEHLEFYSYKNSGCTLTNKENKQDYSNYLERANYVAYRNKK